MPTGLTGPYADPPPSVVPVNWQDDSPAPDTGRVHRHGCGSCVCDLHGFAAAEELGLRGAAGLHSTALRDRQTHSDLSVTLSRNAKVSLN